MYYRKITGSEEKESRETLGLGVREREREAKKQGEKWKRDFGGTAEKTENGEIWGTIHTRKKKERRDAYNPGMEICISLGHVLTDRDLG